MNESQLVARIKAHIATGDRNQSQGRGALYFGRSVSQDAKSTLAKLRLTGNGPPYCKLGRRVVYRPEDLAAWLESRLAHNTSDADARLPKSLTGQRSG
jgi:hypothetical protein